MKLQVGTELGRVIVKFVRDDDDGSYPPLAEVSVSEDGNVQFFQGMERYYLGIREVGVSGSRPKFINGSGKAKNAKNVKRWRPERATTPDEVVKPADQKKKLKAQKKSKKKKKGGKKKK